MSTVPQEEFAQYLRRVQTPTVTEYLNLSSEAFCAIMQHDFQDIIHNGDIITIDPQATPVRGDLVFVARNNKKIVEPFQPVPALTLVKAGHQARQKSDACQIIGVIVAKTSILKK